MTRDDKGSDAKPQERLKTGKEMAAGRTSGGGGGEAPKSTDTIRASGRKVVEITRSALNLSERKKPPRERKE